jgi:hypothetical protein
MLNKNKSYKDIAAAYMKTIKPRNTSTILNDDTSSQRPLSKISEENYSRASLKPTENSRISNKEIPKISQQSQQWPAFMSKMKQNSIPNIIKRARSEQHFGQTPDSQTHEKGGEYMKTLPQPISVIIDDLHHKVNKNVQKHADVFIDRFKGELYNIKKKYADLEMSTPSSNLNLKKIKLDKEIIDRRTERDRYVFKSKLIVFIAWEQSDINSISNEWRNRNNLVKYKNSNQELAQEKRFIDEQIGNAQKNQEKLLRNLGKLCDNAFKQALY